MQRFDNPFAVRNLLRNPFRSPKSYFYDSHSPSQSPPIINCICPCLIDYARTNWIQQQQQQQQLCKISAYPTQYTVVSSILNQLKPIWIPIIGNHDTWIYNHTYNEPKPTGAKEVKGNEVKGNEEKGFRFGFYYDHYLFDMMNAVWFAVFFGRVSVMG